MRTGVIFGTVVGGLALLGSAGCAAPVRLRDAAAIAPAPGHAKTSRRKAAGPKAATAQQDLTAAVAPLASEDGGHVAVAVDDLTTGARAAYGGTDNTFVTASIVKVDILATLLYEAQQAGQSLTEDEQELATTMIENSDNDAASDLYDDAGGATAIDDANRAFGLTGTTVGTDGYWGLTTTTVDDQIALLRLVFSPSVLSPASRDYISGLMSQVEADQRWGVPAAADAGTAYEVKNGWLPNPTLWEINSIGEITHDGQRMLVAVLSDDNASEDSGIATVQGVAEKATAAVASAGPDRG